MGESGRILILGVVLVAVLAAGGTVYVFAPEIFTGGESSPEDVVRGFLEAMNAKDWEGVTSRLSRDARTKTIPEDEAREIVLRARMWALMDQVGPLRFEISEHAMDGDVALVPAEVESRRLLGQAMRQSGTFHLVREDGAWKLLAKVALESGRVVENPLEVIGLARPGDR